MKKMYFILLVVALIFLLAACGGGEKTNVANKDVSEQKDSAAENNKSNEANKDAIEVDKSLFSVEITIPAALIEDEDPKQIKAEAKKEDGIIDVAINSDGSITYKMTKEAHKRMMDEMKVNLEETIDDIVNGDDFSSIKDIKVNKSYTEFTMVVDRNSFENSFDGFAALGLGIGGMFYQLFDGVDIETMKVIIHVEDSNTGEIFNTFVYPDELNKMN